MAIARLPCAKTGLADCNILHIGFTNADTGVVIITGDHAPAFQIWLWRKRIVCEPAMLLRKQVIENL